MLRNIKKWLNATFLSFEGAGTTENSINKACNDIVTAPETDYNKIRGDINGTAENRTAEIEAGGNAGVSGYNVPRSNQGLAGEVAHDGRTDYRGIGDHLKQQLQKTGKTPIELRTATAPSSFYAKIGEAKEGNPYGAFVTQHDISEYGQMHTLLNNDGTVGVAITNDGDIVSVFKNSTKNKDKGAVSSILLPTQLMLQPCTGLIYCCCIVDVFEGGKAVATAGKISLLYILCCHKLVYEKAVLFQQHFKLSLPEAG